MTATVRAATIGAVGGFLFLHPLFMLLMFREPSNPGTTEHWLRPVLDSFRVEMFPMAFAFAAGGALLAAGSQRNRDDESAEKRVGPAEPSDPLADETPSALEVTRRRAIRYLAHDLKNGLGAIVGYTDVLLRKEGLDASHATLIRLRAKNQDMIAHLRSFLDLELLGDRAAASRGPVEVRDLLNSAAEHDDAMHGNARIEVDSAVAPGLRVQADAVVIGRVLDNLVANSVGHNVDRVRVSLTAERSPWGDDVVFMCSDDGVGIPDSLRERLFGDFASGVAGSSLGFSGLGLAFCRHAIHDHGGRIWLDSALGEAGARFCFTLPVPTGR